MPVKLKSQAIQAQRLLLLIKNTFFFVINQLNKKRQLTPIPATINMCRCDYQLFEAIWIAILGVLFQERASRSRIGFVAEREQAQLSRDFVEANTFFLKV